MSLRRHTVRRIPPTHTGRPELDNIAPAVHMLRGFSFIQLGFGALYKPRNLSYTIDNLVRGLASLVGL